LATFHFSLNPAAYQRKPLRGEVAFIHSLKNSLPDDFHVFANLEWISRNDKEGDFSGGLGEIDVIIFHRTWGLLCVEVKGGNKNEFDSTKNSWYQSRGASNDLEKRDHDPVQQARKGMFQLKKWIKSEVLGGKQVDILFGYAVAFPDGVLSLTGNVMPMKLVREIVIQACDLITIKDSIESIFKYWFDTTTRSQGFSFRPVPDEVASWILNALDGKYRVIETPSVALQFANQEMIRLTSEQERAHLCLKCRRLAVVGPAGTGKTVLASARARQWASLGKKVLFLTYNRLLAQHLESQLSQPRIEVTSLHKFIARHRKYSPFADLLPGGLTIDERNELSIVLMEVVEQCSIRYDCIIIDEAQDFAPDWIGILEGLLDDSKTGEIHVYLDPKQDAFGLYKSDLFKVFKETTFTLRQNLRNTLPICLKAYRCGDIQVFDPPPFTGAEIDEKAGQNSKEILNEIQKTIAEWCSVSHLVKLRNIVILSPVHLVKSCIFYGNTNRGDEKWVSCGKYVIMEKKGVGNHFGKERLLYYTVQSFKGCEADAVIFLERDFLAFGVDAIDVKRYIGYSRARFLLKIIY